MLKFINITFLFIFVILIGLYAYKSLITRVSVKTEVDNHAPERQLTGNYLNKPEIEAIIKEYIANNPEEIMNSLEGLHQKKALESNKKAEDYLKANQLPIENAGNPPIIGNDKGNIIIVMFYDYNCSYCKKANEYINQLLENEQNVKVVLRPMPILGDLSLYLSKVALALYKISPEKFYIIHNNIMKMKKINEDLIKELIAQNDIDYRIVENEINSYSIREAVNKNYELAQRIGIKGAPSYVINGQFVAGLLDLEKLEIIISELKKGDS